MPGALTYPPAIDQASTLTLVSGRQCAVEPGSQGSKTARSEESLPMDSESFQTHTETVETWHQDRLNRLREDDGWLTLVALTWLQPGEHQVGSDPQGEVVLPEPLAANLGRLEVTPSKDDGLPAVILHLAADQSVEVDGETLVGPARISLACDAEPVATMVKVGTVTFHIIERSGRLAVRAKDSASPLRAELKGIDRYPVDSKWRIRAEYIPRDQAISLQIPTAIGTVDTLSSPGTVRFEHQGKRMQLDAFETAEADEVWFIFGDRTNGKETYGGGRFLYAKFDEGGDSSQAGPLTVDFNRAYNPPCVFTPYATCPLPSPENRLALAVTAGEKVFGGHH